MAIHFSACSIARSVEYQSSVAKAEAVYAPIDRIGSTLDKWVQKYGSEYDFDVESGGSDPNTYQPIILLAFQLPGVHAAFGFFALSDDSELMFLFAKNRQFLELLELPFDIDDLDSVEILGPPDYDYEVQDKALFEDVDYDREMVFKYCRGSECSDMMLAISDGAIVGIVWQWEYQ